MLLHRSYHFLLHMLKSLSQVQRLSVFQVARAKFHGLRSFRVTPPRLTQTKGLTLATVTLLALVVPTEHPASESSRKLLKDSSFSLRWWLDPARRGLSAQPCTEVTRLQSESTVGRRPFRP